MSPTDHLFCYFCKKAPDKQVALAYHEGEEVAPVPYVTFVIGGNPGTHVCTAHGVMMHDAVNVGRRKADRARAARLLQSERKKKLANSQ